MWEPGCFAGGACEARAFASQSVTCSLALQGTSSCLAEYATEDRLEQSAHNVGPGDPGHHKKGQSGGSEQHQGILDRALTARTSGSRTAAADQAHETNEWHF